MRATLQKLWTFGAILLGAVSSGCISFSGSFGTEIPVESIPQIQDGITTRDQIMSWFGPPSAFFKPSLLDVIFEEEEDVMKPKPVLLDDVYTYRYVETQSTLFFIPILVGIFDAVAVSETLTIFFDETGKVEYHAYRRDDPRPRKDD
jgi:hypothetical protein